MSPAERPRHSGEDATPSRRSAGIDISPKAAAAALTGGAVVIVAGSIVGQVLKHGTGHDYVFGLVPLFDVDAEVNVPTWYSSVLLLTAAALLGLIAAAGRSLERRDRRCWFALAMIFLLLSLDETASFHESLNHPVAALVGPEVSGLVLAPWLIAGGLFVLVCGVLFLGFLRRLPGETRRPFFVAAGLFLGGAIGVEFASFQYARLAGLSSTNDPGWSAFVTVEESLEMAGVIVFVYALLGFLERHVGAFEIRFATGPGRAVPESASDPEEPVASRSAAIS